MVVIIFKSVQYLCKMTLICIFKDEKIIPERFSDIPKVPEPVVGESFGVLTQAPGRGIN